MPCLANSPANTIQMNVKKKETIFFVLGFFKKHFLMTQPALLQNVMSSVCAQRHERHCVV